MCLGRIGHVGLEDPVGVVLGRDDHRRRVRALDLGHAGILDARGQVPLADVRVVLDRVEVQLPGEAGVLRRRRLTVRPLEVRPELERPRLAVGGSLPGRREGRDRLDVRAEARPADPRSARTPRSSRRRVAWYGFVASMAWVVPIRRVLSLMIAAAGTAAGSSVVSASPVASARRVSRSARVRRIRGSSSGRATDPSPDARPPIPGVRTVAQPVGTGQWPGRASRPTHRPNASGIQTMKLVGGSASEQDRPVDPEAGDVVGRRRRAVDDQLGQDAAEERGELEGMGGAERHEHVRSLGHAGRGRSPGPASACTGRSSCRCRARPRRAGGRAGRRVDAGVRIGVDVERPLVGPSSRVRRRPGPPSGRARRRSGSRRSTARPSRSRPGTDPGAKSSGSGAGVVGHLLLGDRQRQPASERRQAARSSRRRRPARRARPGDVVPSAVLSSISPPPASRSAVTGRPVEERRAVRRGRAAGGRRCARFGSARPPSAWNSPWCSSDRRHCGQRRMISSAVEVLERARPRRSCWRCSPRAGSPRRAARHRARRSS